jgi:glycosyltransferase involved in cell wall biosynthesis
MIRICSSLQNAGYQCTLVGKKHAGDIELEEQPYQQKRLNLFFKKGFLFYAEYNIKLFFYLLFAKADVFCCIDIDTMLANYLASAIRGKKRVYDAHEYFSQMKEVVTRKNIYNVWHTIERKLIPKFKFGYTVSQSIANEFKNLYQVDYATIRNLPLLQKEDTTTKEYVIVYQGAVNHGRGFESLIPAMQQVDAMLNIYGDGNFLTETEQLIQQYNLSNKVLLKGKLKPEELKKTTAKAYIGINLVENTGLSQYYSLANKFFDYIQHGIPQVTMNYPEYAAINNQFNVALLIQSIEPTEIAQALNTLLQNKTLYATLRQNCIAAAQVFNWQAEEKKLIAFYKLHVR